MFGLVEEFILPFVLDHVRPICSGDDGRVRALLQFAAEEAKHIQLFKRFQKPSPRLRPECEVIGPPEAVAKVVLGHEPLSVALFILMIEWMTQSHYVDSVRGDGRLEPLFANLLRCHWIEEAQHAKLDTLMVEALAEGGDEAGVMRGGRRLCWRSSASSTRAQAAGRVQPRRARAGHRPEAASAGRADQAAASGAALDLHRIWHAA